VRTDDEVEALLTDHPDAVADTARRLREVVLGAHPQLVERVQRGWHTINYRDPTAGFVAAIQPTADGVQLVLVRGVLLPDPDGVLCGSGKQARSLVFATAADVDEDVVTRFLDLTIDLAAALRRR
jgi:hypothetical protein